MVGKILFYSTSSFLIFRLCGIGKFLLQISHLLWMLDIYFHKYSIMHYAYCMYASIKIQFTVVGYHMKLHVYEIEEYIFVVFILAGKFFCLKAAGYNSQFANAIQYSH